MVRDTRVTPGGPEKMERRDVALGGPRFREMEGDGRRKGGGGARPSDCRICTYLQSVQVNVVERAVNARCQIMRHLDTPLALPSVASLSFFPLRSELADLQREHRSNDSAVQRSSLFLARSSFLLLSLPPSRRLLCREPNENTRAEKGRSEDAGLAVHSSRQRAPRGHAERIEEHRRARLRERRRLAEPRRDARRRAAGRRRTRSDDGAAHGARGEHTENRRRAGAWRAEESEDTAGGGRLAVKPDSVAPPSPFVPSLFLSLPRAAFFLARDAKGAPSSIYRVLSLSLARSRLYSRRGFTEIVAADAGEFGAETNRAEPSRTTSLRISRVFPSTTAPSCTAVQHRRGSRTPLLSLFLPFEACAFERAVSVYSSLLVARLHTANAPADVSRWVKPTWRWSTAMHSRYTR